MAAVTAAGAIEAVWRIESARIIAGPDPARAGRRPGRGTGPGRVRDRPGALADRGRAGQPGRLAHGDGQAPGGRPRAPAHDVPAQARRAGPRPRAAARLVGDRRGASRSIDDYVGDDLLRLMFIANHPVLSTESRVALTLRLLGGLTTDEIARADARARAHGGPAHRPGQAHAGGQEHPVRAAAAGRDRCNGSPAVLEVVYLIFNEGYAATAGEQWTRPTLCEEAMRLGRVLAGLVPDGARGARAARPDGIAGVPVARPPRARRRTRAAARPGPPAVGPPADPARAGRAGPGRGLGGGPYTPAGRHRRVSRPGPHGGRHRLGADREPLHRARVTSRPRRWSS